MRPDPYGDGRSSRFHKGRGGASQLVCIVSFEVRDSLKSLRGFIFRVDVALFNESVEKSLRAGYGARMEDLFARGLAEVTGTEKDPARTVAVLTTAPVERPYDYAVGQGMDLSVGDYVIAPMGKTLVPGVVLGEGAGDVSPLRLKTIRSRFDLPPLPSVHRAFVDRVAAYTLSPVGAVLKMVLPVPEALEPPEVVKGYVLSETGRAREAEPGAVSPSHRRILEVLSDGVPRRGAEVARLAGCGPGVLKTLEKKGLVQLQELKLPPPCTAPDPTRTGPRLSEDQAKAARSLGQAVEAGGYSATLLDGVTGAGKTEVYFEAVAAALETGRQTLILLPEIALSNAFMDRFRSRFGCAPALWHSALSPSARRATWRGVAQGQVRVVVGARSALFLPYADLGLIVVDEEHDAAFKQEEGVIYHARDMAVLRAHLGKIPVVLVSATPSLETIHNVWAGRYAHLKLPDRHGEAGLPDIHILDLKKDRPERQSFIAPTLRKAMAQTLAEGEQSLLFLNRRGYAPLTLCRACGHRMACPRCTAWLVEHRGRGRLACHHCGFSTLLPRTCPSCAEADSFAACGPGVERIHEEVRALFPDARTIVLASDTAGSEAALRTALEDIREHRVDIVIGTQIVAKGHHFPKLTLVGVIDADLGLAGGELRATERTYQLLHQVAGRAGREARPGRVYLQTFSPDSRVIRALAAGDRDAFLEVEAGERERAAMPPFTRLAAVIVSGANEAQVEAAAKALGQAAPHGPGIRTLGPAEAALARLRGQYRQRLLVVAERSVALQAVMRAWIASVKVPAAVRVRVDIDPQTFG